MIIINIKTGVDQYTIIDGVINTNPHLEHRVAVIQDTHKAGDPDTYFDEKLFYTIVSYFEEKFSAPLVVYKKAKTMDQSVDSFIKELQNLDKVDREPPDCFVAEHNGTVIAICCVEFWCLIGGPKLYHDSYTYSIFTETDIATEIREYIESKNSGEWQISVEAIS